jgi:hypothetical protein
MIYGRALAFASEKGYRFVYPTWASFKLGPYIRREKDKRFYGNLFRNKNGALGGIGKAWRRLVCHKVNEKDAKSAKDGDMIVFKKYIPTLKAAGLLPYASLIREDLVKNCCKKYTLPEGIRGAIAMHVRLGDFTRTTENALREGKENCSSPIAWYVHTVKKIRDAVGYDVPVVLFSDGRDEELAELLALPAVSRAFCGNAINDILAMGEAPLLIASGSTFSLWGRFLGKMSAIAFPGQLRERVLAEGESGFEREMDFDDAFCKEEISLLTSWYKKNEGEPL